jgi:hypothetical protein
VIVRCRSVRTASTSTHTRTLSEEHEMAIDRPQAPGIAVEAGETLDQLLIVAYP